MLEILNLVVIAGVFVIIVLHEKDVRKKLEKLKVYEELDEKGIIYNLKIPVRDAFGDYITIDAGDEEQLMKAKKVVGKQACMTFEAIVNERLDDFIVVEESPITKESIEVGWKIIFTTEIKPRKIE